MVVDFAADGGPLLPAPGRPHWSLPGGAALGALDASAHALLLASAGGVSLGDGRWGDLPAFALPLIADAPHLRGAAPVPWRQRAQRRTAALLGAAPGLRPMDLSHARRIVAARPRGDWQLHTDGGVTGDGDGASGGGASGGGGVVISLGPPSEGRVLAEVAIYWPPECRVTVPEAELIAVLVAVRMAAVLGIAAFSSLGDAAAVFGALNGEMEVQAASSHALMRVAVAMLRCFPRRFRFVHVPRAENAAADALTHVARERRISLAALRTTPCVPA